MEMKLHFMAAGLDKLNQLRQRTHSNLGTTGVQASHKKDGLDAMPGKDFKLITNTKLALSDPSIKIPVNIAGQRVGSPVRVNRIDLGIDSKQKVHFP
jgi:hypothetical protein